jgi:sugar lactone lactonase YvrE
MKTTSTRYFLFLSPLVLAAFVSPVYGQAIYSTPYTITTLAGLAGSTGSADGTGSDARFGYSIYAFGIGPTGVAVDSAGNVYVADTGNYTIRKVTPAGAVTTLAGQAGSVGSADGTGGNARFFSPWGVAVDSAGNVYVSDYENNTIRKVTPAGAVTTLAGLAGSRGSVDGTGSDARFFNPRGVAVDSAGNVYVAETGNHTIRKITQAGVVTTLAGNASITDPYGDPIGGYVDGTGTDARFHFPTDVAVDSAGNLYVTDLGNQVIRKVTPAGVVTTLAGRAGQPDTVVDANGLNAVFYNPIGVAVDSVGNVYVADLDNRVIRKIAPSADVTTLAGQVFVSGSADGTGNGAQFYYPYAVAVDSAGNLYVADAGNHTIRKGVPATCATNSVIVTKFNDLNGDGVWETNEPVLSGVSINAFDQNTNLAASGITDTNGQFLLQLPCGTYTITESNQPGWTQTWPTNGYYVVTVNNGQTTNLTFGNTTNCVTISGGKFNDLNGDQIKEENEPWISNWTIMLASGTPENHGPLTIVQTDANGQYQFKVAAGQYVVFEGSQSGWCPTEPAEGYYTVTLDCGGQTNLNFGNTTNCPTPSPVNISIYDASGWHFSIIKPFYGILYTNSTDLNDPNAWFPWEESQYSTKANVVVNPGASNVFFRWHKP